VGGGGKGGRCVGLTLPIVLKSGSLKFLETSGPGQDCLGILFYEYLRIMNSKPKELQGKINKYSKRNA